MVFLIAQAPKSILGVYKGEFAKLKVQAAACLYRALRLNQPALMYRCANKR